MLRRAVVVNGCDVQKNAVCAGAHSSCRAAQVFLYSYMSYMDS